MRILRKYGLDLPEKRQFIDGGECPAFPQPLDPLKGLVPQEISVFINNNVTSFRINHNHPRSFLKLPEINSRGHYSKNHYFFRYKKPAAPKKDRRITVGTARAGSMKKIFVPEK
jgi:hypothetical protein